MSRVATREGRGGSAWLLETGVGVVVAAVYLLTLSGNHSENEDSINYAVRIRDDPHSQFFEGVHVVFDWVAWVVYETVRALFVAIQNAGSLQPDAIRNALARLQLKDSILPGGVLKFSKTGEATLPFVVTQNKPAGKLDLVWPKAAKTGEPVAPIPR